METVILIVAWALLLPCIPHVAPGLSTLTKVFMGIGGSVAMVLYFYDQPLWKVRHWICDYFAAKKAKKFSGCVSVVIPWHESFGGETARFEIYELQDRLRVAIRRQKLGEFDGNEMSAEEVILYMYGASAEDLFVGVEPLLRECRICKGAKVIIEDHRDGRCTREIVLGSE